MRALLLGLLLLISTTTLADQSLDAKGIELAKKDYLAMIVCNFVYGFIKFEMSVTTTDNLVSVGVYYNSRFNADSLAYDLAEVFREEIPAILKEYEWANDVSVEVIVYGESRIRRSYMLPY